MMMKRGLTEGVKVIEDGSFVVGKCVVVRAV